jgi:hypothetical protein
MRKQRAWLRKNFGVYDQAGHLVGFTWTNEGSGRDNAPRPLDETGLDALPEYGEPQEAAPGREKRGLAVDLLAQYKTLIDHEREFDERLGRARDAARAAAEAREIADLLNKYYFNKSLGWYVDLVPKGKKDWKQAGIVTLAGFWPVAAKVATRAQIAGMIRDYLENPKKFGGLFPGSVPKDNPYYDEAGHYWRGGGWPSDWEMVSRALRESGFRAEAALLAEREMAAISVASQGYVKGDSPQFMVQWIGAKKADGPEAYKAARARLDEYSRKFWSGAIHNPEKTDPAGTVFEFYGIRRDPESGEPRASFGRHVGVEYNLPHLTRTGFAGWGAVVPLRSAHSIFGLDAVPAFLGPEAEAGLWLYSLFRDPELAYHATRYVPALVPLARFLEDRPSAPPAAFSAKLATQRAKDPALGGQLSLLRQGYVEISPTFDPLTSGSELKNFNYDGTVFTLALERLGDGGLRARVESKNKIRLQVNRFWRGDGAKSASVDEPLASSPIFEIGGDTPIVTLTGFEGAPQSASN